MHGAIHLFATMIKIRSADTLGGRTGLSLTLPRTFLGIQHEVVLLVQKTPQHTRVKPKVNGCFIRDNVINMNKVQKQRSPFRFVTAILNWARPTIRRLSLKYENVILTTHKTTIMSLILFDENFIVFLKLIDCDIQLLILHQIFWTNYWKTVDLNAIIT